MRHPKGLVNGYHRRKIAPVDEPVITARGFALVDPSSIAQYAILESMTISNRLYPAHQYATSREHGKARGLSADGRRVCNIPYFCCWLGRLARLAQRGGYH